MIRNYPKLPVKVLDNQYGYMPAKTYYYIVDADGLTYHSGDGKWRSKTLKQLWTHGYRDKESAERQASEFNNNHFTHPQKLRQNENQNICLPNICRWNFRNRYTSTTKQGFRKDKRHI